MDETGADYSKSGLLSFLGQVAKNGLANPNTAAGLKAACSRLLEDLSDLDDVRKVDVSTLAVRYKNKHPGELSPPSLKEYSRRVEMALELYLGYLKDPANFKPFGRGATKPKENGKPELRIKRVRSKSAEETRSPQEPTGGSPSLHSVPTLPMSYPLRPDFLAQLVIPRDLTSEEARRLSGFLQTLAVDYQPEK